MPIVTITSDFGIDDFYVAAIKGALLCENDQLSLVDISHNVRPYDIVQGAFILQNAYPNFPEGSVHILSVNNFYQKDICFLAIRQEGHYFIGPDNGIFALLFDGNPELAVELEAKVKDLASLKTMIAKTVAKLANQQPINEIGIPIQQIKQAIAFRPVIREDRIQGTIIHIDHYGNAIVNIQKDLFEKTAKERSFKLLYKRNDPIRKMSTNYQDVPIGAILCLFNSSNYLEIAINSGQAASLLDLKIEDTVVVDFD